MSVLLQPSPPDDRLASRFVERRRPSRQREAEVHRGLPGGNPGEHAVPDHPACQVLVEAQVHERLDEVPGLRVADRHRMTDDAAHWIRDAALVARGVAEERDDVPRGRQTDGEHQRILRRVDQLVQLRRVDVLEAHLRGIRRAWKQRGGAVGKRPR